MKRILLVDGMALLFRGYFATAYSGNFMRREDGTPTNGVHQFLKYFLDGIKTFDPSHIFCCWDMGSKTFRTEMYPNYKANRSAPPEELIPQFELVKDVVTLFNVPNIGEENYEADDVIGSLAEKYLDDYEIVIQTGDQDMLQLVQPHVNVAIMKKGIGNYDVYTEENFYDKKGVRPNQIAELKGFTGDSADNYPGIKGIGEKTALTLLQTYDTIENILKKQSELTKGLQKKLAEQLDMFHLCKSLAEIKCDLPLTCQIDEAVRHFEVETINTGMKTYGIRLRSIEEYL